MLALGFGVFYFGTLLLLFFLAFGLCIRVSPNAILYRFARKFPAKSRLSRDGMCFKQLRSEGTFSSAANGDPCSTNSYAEDDLGLDEIHEANEDFEVDKELSVPALTEMVKAEKRKADAALRDLDKERMAAASAVEEAMAMIFRLQNDKSELRIQVIQLQRWAEEKQIYDQEVLQSFEWKIMQYEEERRLMEEELKFCKNRLMVNEKDNEIDAFDCIATVVVTPCTPGLSQSHLNGRRFDGLRVGSLDLGFVDARHDPD